MADAEIRVPQGRAGFVRLGDPAATLPAPVRKKYKELRGRIERARESFEASSRKRQVLGDSIRMLAAEIEAMTLPIGRSNAQFSGRGLTEDGGEVRHAKARLDSLREDLDEANAIYGDKSRGALEQLVRRLGEFIGHNAIFALAPPITVQPRKGETLPAAIESRRRRLRELAADLEAVKCAPWPSSLTKKIARTQIEELVRRGRPDVFGLVERGLPIEWPTSLIELASADLPERLRSPIDAAALVAWAVGAPALTAAVEREIDELSDDAAALTAEQRREKMAQIASDTLAVEREEEALIELAEAENLPVQRRGDADPRAVLGIEAPAAMLAQAS